MRAEHPKDWTSPSWHPDYGEAATEFLMFKDFAGRLCDVSSRFVPHLDCFAEGYMAVNILEGGVKVAEVQIVQRDPASDSRTYGLFSKYADDGEQYFDEVRSLVNAVLNLR